MMGWRIWVPSVAVGAAVFIFSEPRAPSMSIMAAVLSGAALWGWYSFRRLREVLSFLTVIGAFFAGVAFFGRLGGSAAVLPVLAAVSVGCLLAEGWATRKGLAYAPAGRATIEAARLVAPVAFFLWAATLLGAGLGFLLSFPKGVAAMAVASFFIVWPEVSRAKDVGTRRPLLAAAVVSLLVAQTFWVVSFWPIGGVGGGAVVAVVGTVLTALSREQLGGRLSRGRLAFALVLGSIFLALIIALSR
ncbi:hypothetical protein HYZ80_00520 [Candidatus Parcubacteria bacterium]|nr:hypothetical protein [Candidatus Parcubacteria bacterium]